MVYVAQLVESRIVIPVVVGSSPIIHPNLTLLKYYMVVCRFRTPEDRVRASVGAPLYINMSFSEALSLRLVEVKNVQDKKQHEDFLNFICASRHLECDVMTQVVSADKSTRDKLCQSCQHRVLEKCSKIGCFTNVITSIPMFKCPEGRW